MGVSQSTFAYEIGCLILLIFLKLFILIFFLPLIHKIFKCIYEKDEMYIEIYKHYCNELDFWDPWERWK